MVISWTIMRYVVVALLFSFVGFYGEHLVLVNFKNKIEAEAKLQQEQSKNINLEQQHVSDATEIDFNKRLNELDLYYNGLRETPSTCTMPAVPVATGHSNDTTGHNLAADCAKTTLTLVTLQKWIKDEAALHDTK